MGAVAWAMRQRSVSHPRSSNRTCRFPASGFPTSFIVRHTEKSSGRKRPLRGGFSPSPYDTAFSEGSGSFPVLQGSSPITFTSPSSKAHQKSGSFPPFYPLSSPCWSWSCLLLRWRRTIDLLMCTLRPLVGRRTRSAARFGRRCPPFAGGDVEPVPATGSDLAAKLGLEHPLPPRSRANKRTAFRAIRDAWPRTWPAGATPGSRR